MNAGTWPYADEPCTYTSGAQTCSEIPSTFAWGRKAPSIHSVPRGGRIRVLFRERLCTRKKRFTQFTTPFAQAWSKMLYHERLKSLGLYSLQRRRERYCIIYIWKIIEGLAPNFSNPVTGTVSERNAGRPSFPMSM